MKPLPYCAAVGIVCVLPACVCRSAIGAGAFAPIANPDFAQGSSAPVAWKLSGGEGRWLGHNVLEVTGTGDDANDWRCDYRFTPGALYQFTMTARQVDGSGSVVCGPAFANRDYRVSGDWKSYEHVFRVPENVSGSYLRLGQWHASGSVQFDAVRLSPVLAVHTLIPPPASVASSASSSGEVLLGEGESIRDGRYTFNGTFSHEGSNYHRTLHSATAGFNSDRWVFGRGSQVTYRFEVPEARFLRGQVGFNVNYHVRGGCLAEISYDAAHWQPLATRNKLGAVQAGLPEGLLPARTLYLRLSSVSPDSSFQINRVEFQADVDGPKRDGTGCTHFATLETHDPSVTIARIFTLGPQCRWLGVDVANSGDKAVSAKITLNRTADDAASRDGAYVGSFRCSIDPHGRGRQLVPVSLTPGQQEFFVAVETENGPAAKAVFTLSVPDYYRSDYGRRITGVAKRAGLWWSDATRKISPQCSLPAETSAAVQLAAARNDFEPVQIVLHPTEALKRVTASAGSLSGRDGSTIPAENVQIFRVAYHFVHHPTDKTGVRDFWPDALPPLAEPIDVPAGKNQPLWVLVHVPQDAKAGDYFGKISLKAEGFSADVPIKLHVWDFALPQRNHLETAFGFSTGNVFRYHGLKTDEDKRRVLDMYFQNFAEHRISPYDPAPLDRIGVKFRPDARAPDAEVDFSAFDRAMTRAVEQYNFTGIRLPIQGMGGGTFHSRSEPSIGRFGEDTPEYRAMFSSYVGQLEAHLREKGWLKLAYIYWFDEPAPKDYEFVAAGMNRLKKYAPGLQRMLTEEPGDNLLSGTVDIWCPVSSNYQHEAAERRRSHGERFWWYVCTGPKAPYCTLFIDHPATELRVWLWQTWQRKIVGNLVWQSNYWTSSAAFPDEPQNPYEDPMGYRSGYSTPRGVKSYWGNGDGRFIYPPEAAAVPGKSGPDPVIEPPVSSIRWEMLREGIEDYEMLYLLRDRLAKRRDGLSPEQIEKYESLLEVPESITRDMTTFTTDPGPIYARRAEVARAIEELSQ